MKPFFRTLIALWMAAHAALAGAHGAHAHDGQKKSPLAAEQKPWGIAGEAGKVARTIDIRMGDDMRFMPEKLDIRLGETIRFRVRNDGKVQHELVIGTLEELKSHAALMLKHPNMVHDEPWMAHVDPGRTGDLLWTFNRAGEFEFACLVAGHFEAGMRGVIRVAAHNHSSAGKVVDEWVEGEIRRIDREQGKISIRHGEIRSLDMPPMTMVFEAAQSSLLNGLSPGERIRFRLTVDGDRYQVTAIERR